MYIYIIYEGSCGIMDIIVGKVQGQSCLHFQIALISLRKVRIQLSCLQLWVK